MNRRNARTAAALLSTTALLLGAGIASAQASTKTSSDTQYFQGSYTHGYYAGMHFTTTGSFNSSRTAVSQSGTTYGGAYYSGPYGDSSVKASSLSHAWTIILDGVSAQSCSIGFPSGFTCTVTSGNVKLTKSSSFGASLPTSTSLPSKTYNTGSGAWTAIQFDSDWTVRYAPSGTTIERVVGNSNRHT